MGNEICSPDELYITKDLADSIMYLAQNNACYEAILFYRPHIVNQMNGDAVRKVTENFVLGVIVTGVLDDQGDFCYERQCKMDDLICGLRGVDVVSEKITLGNYSSSVSPEDYHSDQQPKDFKEASRLVVVDENDGRYEYLLGFEERFVSACYKYPVVKLFSSIGDVFDLPCCD